MRIAVLSGADKNAGDFLIVHRAEELLRYFMPSCELVEFKRNLPLDDKLDELNSCALVVFAGGPGYLPEMYPVRFPLVKDIKLIKPLFLALGMGGYTATSDAALTKFTDKSKELLDRIEHDGFGLGCRDYLSVNLLRANGYKSAFFTGCPAWFDLDKVNESVLLKHPAIHEVKSIAISDPADMNNIDAVRYLIAGLQETFPSATLKLVFHRGWKKDEYSRGALARRQQKLVEWATEHGVRSIDISYGWEGFHEYDDCDIHVGYRVHAHLYNVSQRKPSFLIEEDGRGYGANEALYRSVHVGIRRNPIFLRKVTGAFSRLGLDVCPPNFSHQETALRMVKSVVQEIESGYPENVASCIAAHDAFVAMSSQLEEVNKRLREVV